MSAASASRPWRYGLLALVIVLVGLVLDQASKAWILYGVFPPMGAVDAAMPTAAWPWQRIEVLPVFDIVMVWNFGFSFGTLNGANLPYQAVGLAALALAVAAGLVVWLRRADNALLATGIALIVSGAIGNAIDRLRFGAVVDFLGVHWQDWHFPAFNIADSAITIGVIAILADNLFLQRRQGDAGKSADTAPPTASQRT